MWHVEERLKLIFGGCSNILMSTCWAVGRLGLTVDWGGEVVEAKGGADHPSPLPGWLYQGAQGGLHTTDEPKLILCFSQCFTCVLSLIFNLILCLWILFLQMIYFWHLDISDMVCVITHNLCNYMACVITHTMCNYRSSTANKALRIYWLLRTCLRKRQILISDWQMLMFLNSWKNESILVPWPNC